MRSWLRAASVLVTTVALAAPALADEPMEPPPGGLPMPSGMGPEAAPSPPPDEKPPQTEEEKKKAKEPKRGDFDAGGQVRLPNGPDEEGVFKTFNWVAFDVKGRYFLLDSVTVNANLPLAVKKPEMLMTGEDPRLIGGMNLSLEAKLPVMKVPFAPKMTEGTEVGVSLSGAYMREGAMLLSEKDYPKFTGGFKPGFTAGLITKVKLSTLVDFKLLPVFVYQSGTDESLMAVQVPMSTIISLGSLLKVSADLGVYTGDDFTFRGSKGGRLALGAAIDLKIGPIITHAGAGAASLLTGGVYPEISDSLYIDLNVKYAK
jgi:hypothetical protein